MPAMPPGSPPPDKPSVKRLRASDRATIVAEMNQEYAVLLLGEGPVVLHEGFDVEDRPDIQFLSVSGFHEWMRPNVVWIEERKVAKSKIWIGDEARRQFNGLVFDPSKMSPSNFYNLWKGFAVQPAERGAKATCQLFLNHVYENVCAGNEHWFAWVMAFFADMMQNPSDKPGVALVLRGTQGTGKTLIGTTIGTLVGRQHYQLVSDAQRVVGRFNSHLAQCLFLQLDEATWGGDHAAAGKLKDFITGDWQYIERKGRESVRVRNHARLLVTGNNDWLIPAAPEERRFAVFDMAEDQRQNGRYFGAIVAELEQGGYEALLRYLTDFDLTTVNLRDIPDTGALAEQKSRSLSVEQAWWLDILHRGALPGDIVGVGEIDAHALYMHYVEYAKTVGETRRMSEQLFGRMLKRMAPGIIKPRKSFALAGGGYARPYYYQLPSLATCRKAFARIVSDEGWGEPDVWIADEKKTERGAV